MEVGEEFEVDVIDMSPNGEGIAKIKGSQSSSKTLKLTST